ncbi:MAG: pilus assembly protein TadE [Acidobacteria bacterium]|nr:MAG: pilus assembly protein TadE [Acidobacteriota bacterium]
MNIEARQRRSTSERGTAIVESAIILPVFFLLLFGVFEAGRFMNTQQVLTDAAREGARLAVTPLTQTNTLPSTGEITTRVNDFLGSASITGATVTVDNAVSVVTGSITTTYTRVRVDEPYQVLTVPGFFSMLQVTLRGEALMRNETSE